MEERISDEVVRHFSKRLVKYEENMPIMSRCIPFSVEDYESSFKAHQFSDVSALPKHSIVVDIKAPSIENIEAAYDRCLSRYKARIDQHKAVHYTHFSSRVYSYGTANPFGYHDHLADASFQTLNRPGSHWVALQEVMQTLVGFDRDDDLRTSDEYLSFCQLVYIAQQHIEVAYCKMVVSYAQSLLSADHSQSATAMVDFLKTPSDCLKIK